MVEHRKQINAIVMETMGSHAGEGQPFASAWAEVRRRLRTLRDTDTTLREDERIALQCLRGL